jgi:hypothetical protein
MALNFTVTSMHPKLLAKYEQMKLHSEAEMQRELRKADWLGNIYVVVNVAIALVICWAILNS